MWCLNCVHGYFVAAGRKETLSEFHSHLPRSKSVGLKEAEHMRIPSGLVDGKPLVQPVVGSRVQRSIVPFRSSLLADRTSMAMDAGLVQSRRFRVGWAPNWVTASLARQAAVDKGNCSLMSLFYLYVVRFTYHSCGYCLLTEDKWTYCCLLL